MARRGEVAKKDSPSDRSTECPVHRFSSGFRVTLDPAVLIGADGSVLVGGNPLRALRLDPHELGEIHQLVEGESVAVTESNCGLIGALLDLDVLQPAPLGSALRPGDVTVVLPVRDQSHHLEELLRVEAAFEGVATVVVVDDGSQNGEADAMRHACSAAPGGRVTLVRSEVSRGPADARNLGAERATTEVVVFLDADCRPTPGWLGPLLAHFDDEAVAAVAPRMRATRPEGTESSPEAAGPSSSGDSASPKAGGPPSPRTAGLLERLRLRASESLYAYELEIGPLDRGERPAFVGPTRRISFVPTAALAVRRKALEQVGGFDPTLRFGEDIDFTWRLSDLGWGIRYEPSSVVGHQVRSSVSEMIVQRYEYGTPAAILAGRYPHAFRTLEVSPSAAATFALAGSGHVALGTAVAGASAALSARRLESLGIGWTDAFERTAHDHLRDGASLAWTLRRDLWPATLALAVVSRRLRRVAIAATLVVPLVDWLRRKPRLSPLGWLAFSIADGFAHGAGVWAGCIRARSFKALRPAWRSLPAYVSRVSDIQSTRHGCPP